MIVTVVGLSHFHTLTPFWNDFHSIRFVGYIVGVINLLVIHNNLSKHQLNPKWNMGALSTPVTQMTTKLEQKPKKKKINWIKIRLKQLCLYVSVVSVQLMRDSVCVYIIFTRQYNQKYIRCSELDALEWISTNNCHHRIKLPYMCVCLIISA